MLHYVLDDVTRITQNSDSSHCLLGSYIETDLGWA